MPTFDRPRQRPKELARFIALLNDEGVMSYAELGAHAGNTFRAVMRGLPEGARGVAVDMPGGAWGQTESRPHLEGAERELAAEGRDVRVFFGGLRAAATRELVAMHGPYDAMLVDADHRIEAVVMDWAEYGPLARIVAFHDIDGSGKIEVPLLWRVLKRRHRHIEIIDGKARGMGIGVLWRA